MKIMKDKIHFILLIFLSIVLVALLVIPTSFVNAAEILKCQSNKCICVCADPNQCMCTAGNGMCFCVCLDWRLDYSCPEGGSGGGGGWQPPYWY